MCVCGGVCKYLALIELNDEEVDSNGKNYLPT